MNSVCTAGFTPSALLGTKRIVGPGTLGGRLAQVIAINDKGGVLGNRVYNRGQQRGVIKYHGTLPGEDPVTQAEALNNRNQIVDESSPFIAPDPPLRAFIWVKGVDNIARRRGRR